MVVPLSTACSASLASGTDRRGHLWHATRRAGHNGVVDRVCIIGSSGAGKTTLARVIAGGVGLEHIELDAIFHQANWMPLPEEEFRTVVAERCAVPRWVTDGNYRAVTRSIIWPAADTVIWLDYPRWLTTRRVLWRSIRRATTNTELWNGNRESWRNLLSTDPERNVVLWSFTKHHQRRTEYTAAIEGGAFDRATILHFRHPRHTAAWLEGSIVGSHAD